MTVVDLLMIVVLAGSIRADMQSTKAFLRDPQTKEANVLLGERPTSSKLDDYGIAVTALSAGTAMAFPAMMRDAAMGALSGFELEVARENRGTGTDVLALRRASALGGLLGLELSVLPKTHRHWRIGLARSPDGEVGVEASWHF